MQLACAALCRLYVLKMMSPGISVTWHYRQVAFTDYTLQDMDRVSDLIGGRRNLSFLRRSAELSLVAKCSGRHDFFMDWSVDQGGTPLKQ